MKISVSAGLAGANVRVLIKSPISHIADVCQNNEIKNGIVRGVQHEKSSYNG